MSMSSMKDAGFRDLFENSGSVMLLLEPRSACIVEANRAALSYYGYRPDQLIGASINHINTLDWEQTALERQLTPNPERNNFLFRHRLSSGEERDVEVFFSPIESNGRPLVCSIVQDVTEVRQSREDARTSEAIYRSVFRNSLDAIAISRLKDGMYVDVNPRVLHLLGYSRGEMIGRTSIELNIWADLKSREELITNLREKGRVDNFEIQLRRRSGEVFWALTSLSEVDIEGNPHIVSVLKDVSEVKQTEERIRRLVFFDPLTSLPNRRLLSDRIKQSMAEATKTKKALLLIDLIDLGRLNETIGHRFGDLLLKEIARRLEGCTRDGDTVARTGGNEFAVLIEDLSEKREEATAQVHAIARKIQEALIQPCMLANHKVQTGASIGIAVFSSRFKSPNNVLRCVQIANSQARNAGHNKIAFYSPALQAIASARAALEEELRLAINDNQLVFQYQPQVTNTGLIGAEALIRWHHPSRGILAPGEFIALAEETDLIHPLGEWALNRAFSQVAVWAERYELDGFRVAINISAHQFQHPDFLKLVLDAADRSGADPGNITLELTESALMNDVTEVVRKMSLLKLRGFRISMDDFGTGFSSLSFIKKLPLDELKIDRAFVKDILVDPSSRSIARTIMSLARAMGLSVIAEGVETAEQRHFLAHLGCQSFQGYFFSRPVPLDDFERSWLSPAKKTLQPEDQSIRPSDSGAKAESSALDEGKTKTTFELISDRTNLVRKLLAERHNVAVAMTESEWFQGLSAAALQADPELRVDAGDLTSDIDFLAGAVQAGSPDAFGDYARWKARVLCARGIKPQAQQEQLACIEKEIAPRLLPTERDFISLFLRRGRQASMECEPVSDAGHPNPNICFSVRAFLDAILAGRRQQAVKILEDEIQGGARYLDLGVDVVSEALRRVGVLWGQNKISVAQEHMATATAEHALAKIPPRVDPSLPPRGKMVVTGVPGEQHQIGAGMVADAMEAIGWSVRFLGSNLPNPTILSALEEDPADTLCISTTLVANLPAVAELVTSVRARLGEKAPRIVVGGRAFESVPGFAREIGAIEVASDLRQAIEMLSRSQLASCRKPR